jgi:2-keto-3-deoxy-L-rhamnonate aldolase RhmA
MSGLFLLRRVKELRPEIEVILITHSASSYNLLQALRGGAFDFIVRPIDSGEPQLQSADEVRQAVSFLRYPPVGQRGVALRTRGAEMGRLGHADVARVVNDRIVGIVQIESRGSLAVVDEIATLDEVDVLFVGPADLSHSLGVPGRFDDEIYLDAIRSVVAASDAHGKAAGILIFDAAVLERHLELGFRFIGLGSEGAFVSTGARAMLEAAGRT